MKIIQLNIYPLKSARGITLDQALCTREGLAGDRRWILCDPDGTFITQRQLPALARISVSKRDNNLFLSMDGEETIKVTPEPSRQRLNVTVWKDTVNAASASAEADSVLSRWLERPVRLCFFDNQSMRTANRDWVKRDTPVTFADGFQLLVTTTGSLAALNADLHVHGAAPVGMERFRPNIVLDCDEAWVEDEWTGIEINGLALEFAKPCARCIMTTQDQTTGSRDGANPMPAMARLRMSGDRRVPGPLFGWNAVPTGEALFKIGDEVRINGRREVAWSVKKRAS